MSTQLTLLTKKNTGDDVRGSLKIAITFFSRRHITCTLRIGQQILLILSKHF